MVLITSFSWSGLLLVLLLALLLVGGWWQVVGSLCEVWEQRLRRRRRLRELGLCDSGDGVGCSLLICHPRQLEVPARLLTAEPARYEVVAVVDGAQQGDLLRDCIALFSLIRVEYRPSEEFSTFGVRALYRSSRRAFRRLLLLDGRSLSRDEAWTAAAAVATYEWLLPVEEEHLPTVARIEELLSRVEQHCGPPLEWVRAEEGLWLVAREEVVRSGGFGPELRRRLRRKCHYTLCCGSKVPFWRKKRQKSSEVS